MVNAGEGMEKREPSYGASGNVGWCGHGGKQYGDSSAVLLNGIESHDVSTRVSSKWKHFTGIPRFITLLNDTHRGRSS